MPVSIVITLALSVLGKPGKYAREYIRSDGFTCVTWRLWFSFCLQFYSTTRCCGMCSAVWVVLVYKRISKWKLRKSALHVGMFFFFCLIKKNKKQFFLIFISATNISWKCLLIHRWVKCIWYEIQKVYLCQKWVLWYSWWLSNKNQNDVIAKFWNEIVRFISVQCCKHSNSFFFFFFNLFI